MFCLNFSHINHQTSNVGIITPPQYVCPLYQNKPSLCHLLNPLFVCVSLSLSLCTLLLCPPVQVILPTYHIEIWYGTMIPRSLCPLSHSLHHTTTMSKLPPASSFDDIPSRGLFCYKCIRLVCHIFVWSWKGGTNKPSSGTFLVA